MADPPSLEAADLREYAGRDRSELVALKAAHWRDRKARLGPAEALRVADAMRRYYLRLRPGWPDEAEREADLAVHIRVGEALRTLGPQG